MSQLRKIGLAVVVSVTLAGGLMMPAPAYADFARPSFCTQIQSAVDYLKALAARYPNSALISALLARAQAVYAAYCS